MTNNLPPNQNNDLPAFGDTVGIGAQGTPNFPQNGKAPTSGFGPASQRPYGNIPPKPGVNGYATNVPGARPQAPGGLLNPNGPNVGKAPTSGFGPASQRPYGNIPPKPGVNGYATNVPGARPQVNGGLLNPNGPNVGVAPNPGFGPGSQKPYGNVPSKPFENNPQVTNIQRPVIQNNQQVANVNVQRPIIQNTPPAPARGKQPPFNPNPSQPSWHHEEAALPPKEENYPASKPAWHSDGPGNPQISPALESQNAPLLQANPTNGPFGSPEQAQKKAFGEALPSKQVDLGLPSGKDIKAEPKTVEPKGMLGIPTGVWFLIIGVLFLGGVLTLILIDRNSFNPESSVPNPALEQNGMTSLGDVIDPVTKNPVNSASTPYFVEIYGTTFFFESGQSMELFAANPLKYVNPKIKVKVRMKDGTEGDDTEIQIVGPDGRPIVTPSHSIEPSEIPQDLNDESQSSQDQGERMDEEGSMFTAPSSNQAPSENADFDAPGSAPSQAPPSHNSTYPGNQHPSQGAAPSYGDIPPPENSVPGGDGFSDGTNNGEGGYDTFNGSQNGSSGQMPLNQAPMQAPQSVEEVTPPGVNSQGQGQYPGQNQYQGQGQNPDMQQNTQNYQTAPISPQQGYPNQ